MNIICFHNPDEENGYLSNWYRCTFEINGIIFSSMEQFMMYKKAECFRDHLIGHQILETDGFGRMRGKGSNMGNWLVHERSKTF